MAVQARRPWYRRPGPFGVAVSLLIHGAVILAVLAAHGPPTLTDIRPITVQLVDLKPLPDAVTKPSPAPPSPAKPPPPRRAMARPPRTPPPPDIVPLPAGLGPTADGTDELSDSDVASASTAGSGGGGGACNMTRRLQDALRKDHLVQAAVAQAHRGKAILVWNGDWVRRTGQEGNGLAAVREAIMWEVGFAPEPCRHEHVRGMVLISMGDGPGSARIVVGSGEWRWSDLLFVRAGDLGRASSNR